jgi:hypothetical protein
MHNIFANNYFLIQNYFTACLTYPETIWQVEAAHCTQIGQYIEHMYMYVYLHMYVHNNFCNSTPTVRSLQKADSGKHMGMALMRKAISDVGFLIQI